MQPLSNERVRCIRFAMTLDNNTKAFLALVRAGLWEKDDRLSIFGQVDYSEVMCLAEKQSVLGVVAAGLDHIVDVKAPKDVVLQLVGQTLQLEQRNCAMNDFIVKLTKKLSSQNVFSLVVKGQAVAQCYEKPLWRAAGDVDLLLDKSSYEKAKSILLPISYDIQSEDVFKLHSAFCVMGIDVELHGKMPFALSRIVDEVIEAVINNSLVGGGVSAWNVKGTDVFMPNPDNHVVLVFTHFLHHFFIEGVGLRQICDWCRILWTNRSSIDKTLLEQRIRKMGLMTEWKVFAALAVNFLGMPAMAMPFYEEKVYDNKARRVLTRIIRSGNFGHNNDLSYRSKYKGMTYKGISFWRRFLDFVVLAPIFPMDVPKYFISYVSNKIIRS
jgi:hypothetical protein